MNRSRVLVLAIVLFQLSIASASKSESTVVVINPDTLRERILSDNLPIREALEKVHIAKEKVNLARANLLPSLNLSGAASFDGGVSFALTAIEFLVPFLVPSNWFDYYQSKDLLEAEKLSFYVLELNVYASAYSLYNTMLGDQQIYDAIKEEYEDIKKIQDILEKNDEMYAIVAVGDLQRARARTAVAAVKLSQSAQVVASERAALREMLALPLTADIQVEAADVAASEWEGRPVVDVWNQSLGISPEINQVESLIQAGQKDTWSKVFEFILGNSLSSSAQSGQNAALSDLLVDRGSVGIGFGYFPTVRISELNLEVMKRHMEEMQLHQASSVETAMQMTEAAQAQYDLASLAETNMRMAFDATAHRYELGLESLVVLLESRVQMTDTRLMKVKAASDLRTSRVTLHRILLSDQFSLIQGCSAAQLPKSNDQGFWAWLKSIFSGNEEKPKSIDAACRAKQTHVSVTPST